MVHGSFLVSIFITFFLLQHHEGNVALILFCTFLKIDAFSNKSISFWSASKLYNSYTTILSKLIAYIKKKHVFIELLWFICLQCLATSVKSYTTVGSSSNVVMVSKKLAQGTWAVEKETRTPASKFQYANVSKLLNREVYMANLRDLSTGTCHVYCIFDCKVYSASDKKSDASVYYFSVGGTCTQFSLFWIFIREGAFL